MVISHHKFTRGKGGGRDFDYAGSIAVADHAPGT